MEFFVMRRPTHYLATIGSLQLNGQHICYTLEDAVREVVGQPVASWKVQDETAIPAGRYRVTLVDSPRFGPDTLSINDVPGFQYIRMHAGNVPEDTDGCLLLGMEVTGAAILAGTSRPAVELVKSMIVPAIGAGMEVWINIVSAVAP